MQGKGEAVPMSTRSELPPKDMAVLVDEVVQAIVAVCNPADAIMVSVAAVKIIGELARHECGEETAQRLLVEATEKARAIHVQVTPLEESTDDPFVIEPKDPFSIPE